MAEFPFTEAEIEGVAAELRQWGVPPADADGAARAALSVIAPVTRRADRCSRCNGHYDSSRIGSCSCPAVPSMTGEPAKAGVPW
ncbi:MAG: hypothetical protein ABW167_05200 [Baekduia sp.]